jgi:hypothetical protein
MAENRFPQRRILGWALLFQTRNPPSAFPNQNRVSPFPKILFWVENRQNLFAIPAAISLLCAIAIQPFVTITKS